jgi:hypothetical protein
MAHLDLMRDAAKEFRLPADPTSVTSLRVWHCKYKSLGGLSVLTNLTALEIATYPDATFEPLALLDQLETLRVLHLPNVRDLRPLRGLKRLRSLSLETLPSWDASGKVTEVESLAPLANLPLLDSVELFGVVPRSRSIDDLLRVSQLRHAKISKFAKGESERLARALADKAR